MAVLAFALAAALLSPSSPAPLTRVMTTPGIHAVDLRPQDVPSPRPAPERGVPHPDRQDEAASVVPEPAPFLLVGIGLVGLAISSRRWRRAIPGTKV